MRVPAVCLLLASAAMAQNNLPGTKPLAFDGDPAMAMVDGIHAYLDRETARPRSKRPDRDTLRRIIGAVDPRVAVKALLVENTVVRSGYRISAVRWPVFEDVDAEGLLIQPDGTPKARIVALPDADETP